MAVARRQRLVKGFYRGCHNINVLLKDVVEFRQLVRDISRKGSLTGQRAWQQGKN